ncbi:MAG: ATP-binding protein [Candidatus Gastranaerophilales bacterium]|nr:ATP-binding protein [Candidatus Gastranaerophilales bacterium]
MENNFNFDVHTKLGIIKTIGQSIYSSELLKIREAVANSRDNEATYFVIYIDKNNNRISLFDNGKGISKDDYDKIFSNIGYGLSKKDKLTNSYFGLGLMSVIQLGSKVKIVSKNKKDNKTSYLEINTGEIFKEENEDKNIDYIKKFSSYFEKNVNRNELSPLIEDTIKENFKEFPLSYTEIIIEGLDENIIKLLTGENKTDEKSENKDEDFELELCKYLPLKPHKNDDFFSKIKDEKAKLWLKKNFSIELDKAEQKSINKFFKKCEFKDNDEYFKTIDVYIGINYSDKKSIPNVQKLRKLWKYFPKFNTDISFDTGDILYGKSQDGDFKYFLVFSSEDIRESTNASGFWVRNKNFLVKSNDHLRRGKFQIFTKPLDTWIFSEIYHKDMNGFLVVTRDEYVWNTNEFRNFVRNLKNLFGNLDEELRGYWDKTKEVKNSFIDPYLEIKNTKVSVFTKIADTLGKMNIDCHGESAEEILKILDENSDQSLKDNSKNIYNLLLNSDKDEFLLIDNEKYKVIIDKKIKDEKSCEKTIDRDNQKVIIRVSPKLFVGYKMEFLGKTFEICYIKDEINKNGFCLDLANAKIFINPFNCDLSKYSISFLHIYIAIEIAYIKVGKTDETTNMRKYLLDFLGLECMKTNPEKINIFSKGLSDILSDIIV